MQNWEKYEINSCKYLNDSISIKNIVFNRKGGSDSNENDIEVLFKGQKLFSIEAKLSPSQCGQIVLIEDIKGNYEISSKMKYTNPFSKKIVDKINRGIDLLPNDIDLFNWVKEHYRSKNSLFFITSTQVNGFNVIKPISNIDECFNVTAVVRRKRSGTRSIPKREHQNVEKELLLHLKKIKIKRFSFIKGGKDLFLIIEEECYLISDDLYFGKFFLSFTGSGKKYRVKVRATTNNLNVVFSIQYNGVIESSGLNYLNDKIKKLI